ncbi:hypothetical protein AAC387_Pa06g2235 [Persea americana]
MKHHLLSHKPIYLLSFIFLILHSHNPTRAEEVLENPLVYCLYGANYTNGSQFETNLNLLLPSLTTNGPLNNNTFYNTSNGKDPDQVYGFSQCLSGASIDECRLCLNNSRVQILQNCPNKKQAAVRYYNCLLRYSDWRFFSQVEVNQRQGLYNVQNISDPVRFDTLVRTLMENVSTTAAMNPSRIGTGVTNYTQFASLYGLAQCTRDLSNRSCYRCLEEAIAGIKWCCDAKQGGNVYFVSCNIRYDIYPFYPASVNPIRLSIPSPPPPPVAATSPSNAGPDDSGRNTAGGNGKRNSAWRTAFIILISVIVALALISILCLYLFTRRRLKKRTSAVGKVEEVKDMELQFFDLGTLKTATNNFSDENKLGEGGFGAVYKGKLFDGQEIAVKKLSRTSGQGVEELKNEVALVAKLQHKNLVTLLGCCIEEKEQMLVFEYIPNTSLDTFLFDPIKSRQLDWETRYKIIKGISRGLLYLHEDSRLRIIHRDLKASNILLDLDMNPKISDFGLARLFGGDQTQGNTSRIAGTYGYMAPEYATQGQFSIKSDVYSFGVLVLEIVTGLKNSSFDESESSYDLLSYVWRHWTEGTQLELIDKTLRKDCPSSEVLRCIHMGLLCVQEDFNERPTMSSVVLMLNSYSVTLPVPSPPPFYVGKSKLGSYARARDPLSETESGLSVDKSKPCSVNEVSITELDPR